MSGPLLALLLRRYGLACALTAAVPVLLGVVAGELWPQYRDQFATIEKFGVMKLVRSFLRSDLIPSDSSTFVFQLPFVHPVSMLALIVAMALPTLAWPAGARGRNVLDLMLSTPLRRGELVATTFVFTLPFALLHALAPLLGVALGAARADVLRDLPLAAFLRVSGESFALGVFFSGLATLLSVGLRPRRLNRAPEAGQALASLAAVVLWSLLAEVVATMWEPARWLKHWTPFGWFEPPLVLSGATSALRDGSVLAGAGIAFLALAIRNQRARRSA
jgi:hypothetical protein